MEVLESLRESWSGASGPQVALLVAAASWVLEDVTLAGAGVLSGQGVLPLTSALVGAFLGIVSADNLTFLVGRFFGARVLAWSPVRKIFGARTDQGRTLFRARGAQVVFTTRFVPGARLATFLVAGSLGMPWRRFFLATGLAALLWAPAIVLLGRVLGTGVISAFEAIGANPLVAAACGVVLLVLVVRGAQFVASRRSPKGSAD